MSQREPIFNLHPGVSHFLAAIFVMHFVLTALWYLDSQSYQWLFLSLALIPLRYVETVPFLPGGDVATYTSFITYMFVHAGIEHILMNSLFILAFGSAIARRFGYIRFFVFTVICGILGILLHLWVYWGSSSPVIGASAAASGYLAGAMIIIISAFRNNQVGQVNNSPATVKLMTVGEALGDVRVWFMIIVWTLVNWFVGDIGFGVDQNSRVAWEAHLGGFIGGLICIFTFDNRVVQNDDTEGGV